MLNVFILQISNDLWTPLDEKLLNFVSDNRRKKIEHYHFTIDKKLSLYAALLTRMELSIISSLSHNELIFDETPSHKPFLSSCSNLYFNFSHTKNCILLGICDYSSLGVDIEKIKTPPFEVMRLIYHPIEILYSQKESLHPDPTKFFKIWTRKEAYGKYLESGISKSLTHINTLDPIYNNNFESKIFDGYAYSVYCPNITDVKTTIISEQKLYEFYLT